MKIDPLPTINWPYDIDILITKEIHNGRICSIWSIVCYNLQVTKKNLFQNKTDYPANPSKVNSPECMTISRSDKQMELDAILTLDKDINLCKQL